MSIIGDMFGGSSKDALKGDLKVDGTVAKQLEDALGSAQKKIGALRDEVTKTIAEVNSLKDALVAAGDAAPGATGAAGSSRGSYPAAMRDPNQPVNSSAGGMFSGLPTSAKVGGAAVAGGAAIGQLVGAMDRRIDRNIQYAASVDPMNMYMQQLTGRTREQMMAYRRPLMDYRGVDVNALMGFEARTGMGATRQRASMIEGFQHMTGYSIGTEGVLAAQYALMQPDTVNRMFMMTGQSIYRPGGGERDMMELVQTLAGQYGFTSNEEMARTARRPGSISRARMNMAGIPDQIQELMMDYGQMQNQFRKAGGQGDYDPRNEEHRRMLGDAGENLTAKMEETERLRRLREEKMFTSQMDAYLSMEDHQQEMVKLLTSIDDALGGAYSTRAATRPKQRMIGGALMAGGAALAMIPGVGTVLGGTAIGAGMILRGGDPTVDMGFEGGPDSAPSGPTQSAYPSMNVSAPAVMRSHSDANDDNIIVPHSQRGPKPLSFIKKMSTFTGMHPTMQERLLSILRENPNVGFDNGFRSQAEQERLFKANHVVDPEGTISWNGQKWRRTGHQVAPPGGSMHEIGLAADLTGPDSGPGGWLSRNAAKFGLITFDDDRNREPWHVQPAELPRSRREYEAAGAPWGTDGNFEIDPEAADVMGGPFAQEGDDSGDVGGGAASALLWGNSQATISERISSMQAWGKSTIGARGGRSGRGSRGLAGSDSAGGSSGPLENAKSGMNPYPLEPDGTMSLENVLRLAHDVGFRGDRLAKMAAIAWRESRWTPGTHRTNNPAAKDKPDGATGDFGLWQINYRFYYKKGEGPGSAKDKEWGADHKTVLGMNKIQDYLDQVTNARAARLNAEGNGRGGDIDGNMHHLWGVDPTTKQWAGTKGVMLAHTGNKYQEAKAAMHSIGLAGDPTHFGSSYMVTDNLSKKFDKSRPRSSDFSEGYAGSRPYTVVVDARPSGSGESNGAVTSVINVSPNISFNGMPQTPDLERIAKTVTDLMKQEASAMNLRTA